MGFTQVELDKEKYHRGLSQVGNVAFTRHEAAERMAVFSHIKANITEAQAYIRPELADAFFAAIQYPVWAASAMNTKILADSAESHRAYQEIQSLTRQYNEMNGGKWRHLMNAAPRKLPSCIEPGLAIRFTYDITHVSMPFSQIIPPSPSPTEPKRLFYIFEELFKHKFN